VLLASPKNGGLLSPNAEHGSRFGSPGGALREALVGVPLRRRGVDDDRAEAAAALGISETTLRAWERSGRIPKAKRDSAGQRVFTSADVEAIVSQCKIR
jgi:hypothetical protein